MKARRLVRRRQPVVVVVVAVVRSADGHRPLAALGGWAGPVARALPTVRRLPLAEAEAAAEAEVAGSKTIPSPSDSAAVQIRREITPTLL